MREFAKISGRHWRNDLGRCFAKHGPTTIAVAYYLMTCPESNMLGLYWLRLGNVAESCGITEAEVEKALANLAEADFCSFDAKTQYVWIHEMAASQVAPSLRPNDNRVKFVNRTYEQLDDNPFLGAFFDAYRDAFHLTNRRGSNKIQEAIRTRRGVAETSRPEAESEVSEGTTEARICTPSKALRSKEKENEKNNENENQIQKEEESGMPCLGVWEGARARSNAQGIGCNSLSLSPNQDSAEPVEATTECQDQSPGAELEIQFGLREIEIVDGPLPDIERLEQLVALGEHQWHWGPISERWRREAQKLLPISSTELTKAKEKLEAQRGSRPGNFGFLVCIIRSQRENPKPSRKSQPALPSNIQSMLDGAFRYAQQMGEASYV